jgi:hypothetical protein
MKNLKVSVSIPAAATSKAALWAKTAARAVLKTYPGATLTTSVTSNSALTSFVLASALGSTLAGAATA